MDETDQNEAPHKTGGIMQADPFVIVVGNEKGGAGKTTVSMHLIAALLNAGKRVGVIDLDIRQRSLSNYIEHRRRWVGRREIAMPEQIELEGPTGPSIIERQKREASAFVNSVLPTPVGPEKIKLAIGLFGFFKPTLARLIALDTAFTASS